MYQNTCITNIENQKELRTDYPEKYQEIQKNKYYKVARNNQIIPHKNPKK